MEEIISTVRTEPHHGEAHNVGIVYAVQEIRELSVKPNTPASSLAKNEAWF